MAFLLVKDGAVVNILPEAPPEDWSLPGHVVIEGDAQIGWFWNGNAWGPHPGTVPYSISRRQCAKRMFQMGLVNGVEALAMTQFGQMPAFVDAMVSGQPNETEIRIDFAADSYERKNPLLNQLMTAAGYDQFAIDQFFREAAVL
ncbi:MAG: hypothetical protein ACK515_17780 [bacterium]